MQAKWTGTGQNGKLADWAGDGSCTIMNIDESREGFGPEGSAGPACFVRFNHRNITAWLPHAELEEVS
jgi:hypothetical protein